MTTAQKIIKYFAIAFALFLIVTIISGILNAVYALSSVLGLKKDSEILEGEMSGTRFEKKEITELNIDVAYTNLILKTGDSLSVETNQKEIQLKQENGTLQIKEKKNSWFSSNKQGDLILAIPENLDFEKVTIHAGAGKICIENLNTQKLVFELGAGEGQIESLNVTKDCKIDGGAGKLTISEGVIHDLNLDMGVGEINLTTKLIGDNKINAGIGNLNMNLEGEKESYRIKIDKGIGSIKMDGKEVGNNQTYGDGDNNLEIDGGIGNIQVNFIKK